jgi:hypothetical protein
MHVLEGLVNEERGYLDYFVEEDWDDTELILCPSFF